MIRHNELAGSGSSTLPIAREGTRNTPVSRIAARPTATQNHQRFTSGRFGRAAFGSLLMVPSPSKPALLIAVFVLDSLPEGSSIWSHLPYFDTLNFAFTEIDDKDFARRTP